MKIRKNHAEEILRIRETKPPRVSGLEIRVYKWVGAWVASVWVLGIFEGYVGDRGGLVRRRDHARLYRSEELARSAGAGEALGAW
ncbi:hypothetical protein [Caudoviricetes sp.]|nr:hypothetical protein [Caudoviricetes sp.]UOF82767.1 hypothetical protein [Caudoviricetes sp.]